jgi:prepilin-type N-terminal cleavage/methylation domain-containing protein
MKGFSLLEMLITIAVIAVIGSLSFMHYKSFREKAYDGEAQTNLAMIIGAERDYRRQQGTFLATGSEATLNANLAGVFLSTAGGRPWDYLTNRNGANSVCCAQATRTVAPVRRWRLCTNGNQPVAGTCGANAANCP